MWPNFDYLFSSLHLKDFNCVNEFVLATFFIEFYNSSIL